MIEEIQTPQTIPQTFPEDNIQTSENESDVFFTFNEMIKAANSKNSNKRVYELALQFVTAYNIQSRLNIDKKILNNYIDDEEMPDTYIEDWIFSTKKCQIVIDGINERRTYIDEYYESIGEDKPFDGDVSGIAIPTSFDSQEMFYNEIGRHVILLGQHFAIINKDDNSFKTLSTATIIVSAYEDIDDYRTVGNFSNSFFLDNATHGGLIRPGTNIEEDTIKYKDGGSTLTYQGIKYDGSMDPLIRVLCMFQMFAPLKVLVEVRSGGIPAGDPVEESSPSSATFANNYHDSGLSDALSSSPIEEIYPLWATRLIQVNGKSRFGGTGNSYSSGFGEVNKYLNLKDAIVIKAVMTAPNFTTYAESLTFETLTTDEYEDVSASKVPYSDTVPAGNTYYCDTKKYLKLVFFPEDETEFQVKFPNGKFYKG